jgi:poly-gamma-glutamate capsule biosynthesis protein CapA/YwtB (metallophosphatase superfamily)
MSRRPLTASAHQRPTLRLFLCGDVMLGRGIDQILPQPCDPALHEDYVQSALEYVQLAEVANGSVKRPVAPAYVWGVAIDELKQARPDARIINLETSITRSEDFDPKGINYRMSPENAVALAAAHIDCCVLANNHILDWGRAGLLDTLTTLKHLGIKSAGAGRTLEEARAAATLPISGKGRVLVFSFTAVTSGTPRNWAAASGAAGVNLLSDLSDATVHRITDRIIRDHRPGDVVVVSIHWGPNWGYEVSNAQRRFAHALIDNAGVSIIHGHSSHHAKAIEVYQNRLILYGCGDFLNDYEGIRGYEDYRDDLAVMYFVDIAVTSGTVSGIELIPLCIKQFQLVPASASDTDWIQQTLDREGRHFGTSVVVTAPGRLTVSSTATGEIDSHQ